MLNGSPLRRAARRHRHRPPASGTAVAVRGAHAKVCVRAGAGTPACVCTGTRFHTPSKASRDFFSRTLGAACRSRRIAAANATRGRGVVVLFISFSPAYGVTRTRRIYIFTPRRPRGIYFLNNRRNRFTLSIKLINNYRFILFFSVSRRTPVPGRRRARRLRAM